MEVNMSENNLNELYANMQDLWGEFTENHEKFEQKGNKSAGQRARIAIQSLKNLVTEYRKSSVATSKTIQK